MKNLFTIIFAFSFIMNLQSQDMNESLKNGIKDLMTQTDRISDQRKELLESIGTDLAKYRNLNPDSKIIFICTHNSRRSQLSEIWLNTALYYYGINDMEVYSGGTEATAFNHRMVEAVKRFGFDLETIEEGNNPKYQLNMAGNSLGNVMFSKKYQNEANPQENFIAVMVCSDADRGCPIVFGADERYALPYNDPKAYDDTRQEAEAYDNTVMEIGREILYMAQFINQDNN